MLVANRVAFLCMLNNIVLYIVNIQALVYSTFARFVVFHNLTNPFLGVSIKSTIVPHYTCTVLQSKSVDFYHNINFAVYSYILACLKSKFETLLE